MMGDSWGIARPLSLRQALKVAFQILPSRRAALAVRAWQTDFGSSSCVVARLHRSLRPIKRHETIAEKRWGASIVEPASITCMSVVRFRKFHGSWTLDATSEIVHRDGIWLLYEFTWQMDVILLRDRFKGRWLRGYWN
jgi:hypothetical protein